MNTTICQNCTYYIQHYILSNGKLFCIHCGRCIKAKPKTKKPTTPGCQHYVVKAPDAEEYVTKQYLTKTLLDRILSLELLPEITDAPTGDNLDT